mmetsp:Transcript_85336/g.204420  ORF Transcript_85336/g.204420 Transcript_85336/m.204420 type:complete len:262 (+) Transcript_85336:647-1432(+)
MELPEVRISDQLHKWHDPSEDHIVEVEMGSRWQEIREDTEDTSRLLRNANQSQGHAAAQGSDQQHKRDEEETVPFLHLDLHLRARLHAHHGSDDGVHCRWQKCKKHLQRDSRKDSCQQLVQPHVPLHNLLQSWNHLLHRTEGGPARYKNHEGHPKRKDSPYSGQAGPIPPSRIHLFFGKIGIYQIIGIGSCCHAEVGDISCTLLPRSKPLRKLVGKGYKASGRTYNRISSCNSLVQPCLRLRDLLRQCLLTLLAVLQPKTL